MLDDRVEQHCPHFARLSHSFVLSLLLHLLHAIFVAHVFLNLLFLRFVFDDTHYQPTSNLDICGSHPYLLFFQREDLVNQSYSVNVLPMMSDSGNEANDDVVVADEVVASF